MPHPHGAFLPLRRRPFPGRKSVSGSRGDPRSEKEVHLLEGAHVHQPDVGNPQFGDHHEGQQ